MYTFTVHSVNTKTADDTVSENGHINILHKKSTELCATPLVGQSTTVIRTEAPQ